MSNKLVVFYSRTGTTHKAVKKLAEYIDCDIEQIIPLKAYKGLFGWFAGGRGAITEKPAEIRETTTIPENYDSVVICTPVWAGKIPPPVRAYLIKNSKNLKKVAYLLTMGGKDSGKAIEILSEIGGKPSSTIQFSNADRKDASWTERLKEFAAGL